MAFSCCCCGCCVSERLTRHFAEISRRPPQGGQGRCLVLGGEELVVKDISGPGGTHSSDRRHEDPGCVRETEDGDKILAQVPPEDRRFLSPFGSDSGPPVAVA